MQGVVPKPQGPSGNSSSQDWSAPCRRGASTTLQVPSTRGQLFWAGTGVERGGRLLASCTARLGMALSGQDT